MSTLQRLIGIKFKSLQQNIPSIVVLPISNFKLTRNRTLSIGLQLAPSFVSVVSGRKKERKKKEREKKSITQTKQWLCALFQNFQIMFKYPLSPPGQLIQSYFFIYVFQTVIFSSHHHLWYVFKDSRATHVIWSIKQSRSETLNLTLRLT